MPQSLVRYNIKWGNATKRTSSTTPVEMCAKYKRTMLAVLQKNKELARALEAAKAKIVELEMAASRQLKIDGLYLPRLKSWLGTNKDYIRALFENHTRSTRLLQDILTPGVDVTLAVETNLLDEAAAGEPRRLSLHPPGSRYCDQDRSMSTVLEEDEEDKTEVVEPLGDSAGPLEVEPEVSHTSRVTVRKSRRSDHHCSLPEKPLACVNQPSGVPAFAVLDEEASSLVREITGQEKNVVCAETVVVPPPDKLKGHSAHEYSTAFSHRPKIPRTPCSADRDARLVPSPEDACSSPVQTKARSRRVSETPLPLWPRKPASSTRTRRSSSTPVSVAQDTLNKRLSRPVEEVGADVTNTSLLSQTCDVAFVESPSPAQPLQRKTLSPERVDDCSSDENSPPEAKIRRRQSAIKSRALDSAKPKARRATFVVQRERSQMHEGVAAGPMNDTASPLPPSVDQQREQGCGGDWLQDVEGSMQQQCQAALDIASPSFPRHMALLPNQQQRCGDVKRQRGSMSWEKLQRSSHSRKGKKTADSKEDVEGSMQQQRQALLDIASPSSPRHMALLPKQQQRCGDVKRQQGSKSQEKLEQKSHSRKRKKTADFKELARQLAGTPPPAPCHAQHSGHLPLPEALDAGATSSTEDEGGPLCRPSGRPARSASKCTTYKEPSLMKKMRRL